MAKISSASTLDSIALLLIRVPLGLIFAAHGSQKLLGLFGGHGLTATLKNFEAHLGIPPVLTLLANLCFGAALWFSLFASQTVLHPESPVAQSDDLRIQATYGLLLGLALLLGGQVAWALIRFKKT